MLEGDELTSGAIAKGLGFADEAHFWRAFCLFGGESLRELRRDPGAK